MTTIAFFDFDKTLITKNSTQFFVDFFAPGLMNNFFSQFYHLQYFLGFINPEDIVESWMDFLNGYNEADLREVGERIYHKHLEELLCPKIFNCVRMHQKTGHKTVIITASMDFVVRPVLERFGFDHLICTKIINQNQKWVPKKPFSFGVGKRILAEKFCEENNLDLSSSYYYADSIADRFLFEAVKHPIVIRPDMGLKALSFKKGWPILG